METAHATHQFQDYDPSNGFCDICGLSMSAHASAWWLSTTATTSRVEADNDVKIVSQWIEDIEAENPLTEQEYSKHHCRYCEGRCDLISAAFSQGIRDGLKRRPAPALRIEIEATARPWRVADDGRLGHIIDSQGDTIAQTQMLVADPRHEKRSANANLIVQTVNSHTALVEALKLFVAMDKCNYELETMRRSGLFEQVEAALKLARE